MNKKIIIYILSIIVLLVGISGVSQKNKVYKDGIYRVESDVFDKQGWKPFLEMTFKDGEVVDVIFDYNNQDDGRLKTDDDEYNINMLNKVDMNARIYSKEFAIDVMVKQSSEDLDDVSGATHSSHEFRVMTDRIFQKAKAGDTTTEKIKLE